MYMYFQSLVISCTIKIFCTKKFQKPSTGYSTILNLRLVITLDEQLTLHACTYIVHNNWHNAFGNMVSLSFVDNLHVGFHQVPDGLYLSFQLRVHRAHVIFSLQYNRTPGFELSINNIQCNGKISVSPLYSMSFKHSYSIYIQCRSH